MGYFKLTFILTFTALLSLPASAQNLYSQRIQKLGPQPGTSVFSSNSVFYHKGSSSVSELLRIRSRYSSQEGRERLVFDFDGTQAPEVYGHVNVSAQKLRLSLLNANMQKSCPTPKKGNFVEEIKFFLMKKGFVDIEISFKKNVNLDIFHLPAPGRIVVDIM